ncbi:hypothetical protein BMS3Bbin06_00458 [bacterium BMS3Bbin06]|nr:hypothetical protein BMS3Abin08_02150 [bacterium BMS3Abin08]GBE33942.1 hypothetical protein BMS3Bbin06_00458 [bacterium BMS3Bbin06]HDO36556.1 hypothetical protein [Nitrospirota bacterium]
MSDWVLTAKKQKKEFFSELDVLLRALDRFFNPDNLPISESRYTGRNFYNEMLAVRDVILRILSILENVIPENKKNAFWFQKFAEQKFLTDRKRDRFRENLYQQDSPEKSVFFLYDSFINLKVLIHDLLVSEKISYNAYRNFGELIVREIRENKLFDPFRKDIDPEYDSIDNRDISAVVRSIKDRNSRRIASGIFLYLFRFLRYLSHMEVTSHLSVSLNCSYLILVLLRSETRELKGYLDEIISASRSKSLSNVLESISFQFSMEIKRVYEQELWDILTLGTSSQIRGRIENSYGILFNTTEQCIVQLARHFSTGLEGEKIFPSFETKLEQSLKLREDIFVLYRLFRIFEENFEDQERRATLFASIRGYMLYFESFTFRLLRYEDYEDFARFFDGFLDIAPDYLYDDKADKILQKCNRFSIFLKTTLNLVSQRSELVKRPLDKARAEETLRQFLPEDFEI